MVSPYPVTRGVKALLIANVMIFFVQLLPAIGSWLFGMGALVPFEVFGRGQVWRLASYMFLHSTSDFSHLLLNMLALWMFGGELEERWGTKKFISFYFLFGTGAALFGIFYMIDPVMRYVPVIGASGAIFGLLTAYAVYYPTRELLLFFVLPVRAWMVVAGYAVLSLSFAFSHGNAVAHLIHLGGIAVAFAWLKGGPKVEAWYRGQKELWDEKEVRRRVEEQISRKKYYEEKVDPILKKISQEGEGALTKEDKKILEEVWKNKK
ncbi:MAG: rhomboid family intramembrane serine protease [Chitinispirillaceae bacterium]|jgi:membrane associated rhomboid family serine protease